MKTCGHQYYVHQLLEWSGVYTDTVIVSHKVAITIASYLANSYDKSLDGFMVWYTYMYTDV